MHMEFPKWLDCEWCGQGAGLAAAGLKDLEEGANVAAGDAAVLVDVGTGRPCSKSVKNAPMSPPVTPPSWS